MPESNFSRRGFLSTTAAAAAATSVSSLAHAHSTSNSRLRIAFIGVGSRADAHIRSALQLAKLGAVEIVAVCDVYSVNREKKAKWIKKQVGQDPQQIIDYREIIADDTIDAVVISTPDHWHATQTIAALKAGKHVYCEKPMTHTVEEALEVHQAWLDSGKVMQVGVQSTSLPVWNAVNDEIRSGKLGKILMYQTEFFRNSSMGQWRYYRLTKDMTPKTIDWDRFLGTEEGLAPKMPFDRAKFRQWRCYWEFGSGMFTDLFVHRTTSMLKATGLRFPGRVVGAGGTYIEYDGRGVPDVATVVADFNEGVQGLVTATMACQNTPLQQTIRGHHGSIIMGTGQGDEKLGIGEDFSGYNFIAERPQVTHDSKIRNRVEKVGRVDNSSFTHFMNFVEAIVANKPKLVNCSPELGAAAMVIVKLGARSYREGRVFHFDRQTMSFGDGDSSWAEKWHQRSLAGGNPEHVPGWKAGDKGSVLRPEKHQALGGPWVDGVDPGEKA